MFGDTDDERVPESIGTHVEGAKAPESSASGRTSLSSTNRASRFGAHDLCPRLRGWIKNEDGTFTPKRCQANTCPVCGRLNAFHRGLAIAIAKPDHEFTITIRDDQLATLSPEDAWQPVRRRVHRIIERLREATGVPMECAYAVERTDRIHVHVAVRDWTLEQDHALVGVLAKVGGGLADLTDGQPAEIRNLAALSQYLVKTMRSDPATHLALNGGAIANHTRAFYGVPVKQADAHAARADRHARGLAALDEASQRLSEPMPDFQTIEELRNLGTDPNTAA